MATIYLAAVDGSEHSLGAALLAADRAKSDGAKLILLAVIEWSGFTILTPEELEVRHKTREAEIEKAHAESIEPALAAIGESAKQIEIEAVVQHGHLEDVIDDVVRAKNVDQIFIGKHGHMTWDERLLGDGLIDIVKHCPVPVTIVP